jgi:hypothetical protein
LTKIEITPEMLEAGYQALRVSGLTDDLLEADRLVVVEIYRAMRGLEPAEVTLAPFCREAPKKYPKI